MNEHIKTKIQIEETDENLATLYVPLLWLKEEIEMEQKAFNPIICKTCLDWFKSLLEDKQ